MCIRDRLYMVGQRKFQFNDITRKRLREYLDNGGVMVADCAVGSSEFDQSFREEMKQIYKDRQLKPLAANHALFNFINDTRNVQLAPQARTLFGNITQPKLEVIEVDGMLPVIYSRLSMSAGWEQLPRAYNVGYADDDAVKLGVNVLMYVTSH